MGTAVNFPLCDEEKKLLLLCVYGWGTLFVFLVLFWVVPSSSAVQERWLSSALMWLNQGHFVSRPLLRPHLFISTGTTSASNVSSDSKFLLGSVMTLV